MNKLEITGVLTQILQVQTGAKKDGSGDWRKQSFIVKTEDQYNNLYCFEIFGDEKVDNFQKYNKVGQEITVEFNVSTNEYKEKFYTTLNAWKIQPVKSENQQAPQTQSNPQEYKGKQELTENLGGALPGEEEYEDPPF
jgi:Domain of unknown function (DUF3127)